MHSPEPWKTGPINYADIYSSDGELVALVIKRFDKDGQVLESTMANIRLAVTAPRLLKALKHITETLKVFKNETDTVSAYGK